MRRWIILILIAFSLAVTAITVIMAPRMKPVAFEQYAYGNVASVVAAWVLFFAVDRLVAYERKRNLE